jgi:TRAP-type C4-dicarboxylate transport system substrate-binding protein
MALLGVCACAPPAVAADASSGELKLSVAAGPALALGKAAERWSQLLAETGDARLAAKLYAGASLAGRDPAREVAALKEGAADLAVGSALQWSLQVPALGVFAMPWIAPDGDALAALTASEPLRAALAEKLEQQGVILVAIAPLGHRELATTSRAVRAPADLAGLRVRASPLPIVHELMLALGALPQAMGFAQAQAALASGALDGVEGLPTALASARSAVAGQRHLLLWGAVADAMVFAVRKPLWSSLSPDQQQQLRRSAAQAIAETGARARQEAAVRTLSQNGIGVVRVTAAGHEAFRAATGDMRARWRGAIGEDVVTLAERALSARPAPPPGGS